MYNENLIKYQIITEIQKEISQCMHSTCHFHALCIQHVEVYSYSKLRPWIYSYYMNYQHTSFLDEILRGVAFSNDLQQPENETYVGLKENILEKSL